MSELHTTAPVSISQLRAFASVATCGSFSAGAAALGLTQSSVSHAVSKLENALQAKLLLRTSRLQMLTPLGACLLPEIKRILAQVDALPGLGGHAVKANLHLLVTPAFLSNLLLDRIPDWTTRNPHLPLTFARHFLEYSMARDHIDAAILWGDGRWPNAEAVKLGGSELMVVGRGGHASSAAVERGRVPRHYLIRHVQLPYAWQQVSEESGLAMEGEADGMVFDLFSQIMEAAERGLGVALVPAFVARRSIASGAVVPLLAGRTFAADGAYYFLFKPEDRYTPSITRFRDWLVAERI